MNVPFLLLLCLFLFPCAKAALPFPPSQKFEDPSSIRENPPPPQKSLCFAHPSLLSRCAVHSPSPKNSSLWLSMFCFAPADDDDDDPFVLLGCSNKRGGKMTTSSMGAKGPVESSSPRAIIFFAECIFIPTFHFCVKLTFALHRRRSSFHPLPHPHFPFPIQHNNNINPQKHSSKKGMGGGMCCKGLFWGWPSPAVTDWLRPF